jgi:hypothetical protein
MLSNCSPPEMIKLKEVNSSLVMLSPYSDRKKLYRYIRILMYHTWCSGWARSAVALPFTVDRRSNTA